VKDFEEGSVQSYLSTESKRAREKWILPLIAAGSLTFMPQGGLGQLIQLYLRGLNSSPPLISLATSLSSAGILLGSLFGGALSNSHRKKPLLFALLGACAGSVAVLSLLLPAYGALACIFVVFFMLTSFSPIAMAIISRASTMVNRGRNLSALHSARSLGLMLGSMVAGFALVALGFRLSFAVFAIFPLGAAFFVLFLGKESRLSPPRRENALKGMTKGGLGSLYLATVLRQAGTAGAISLIFVYMASLDIPEGTMGMARAANHALQVPAMLLFGQLADRLGRRGVFILGFGLSALVPVFFGLADSAWMVTVGFLAMGIGFSALYVGSTAHIGDRVPMDKQGAMLGLYESSRGLGGVLGPLIAGAIAPVVGFRHMFFVMAGIAAAGFLLVLLSRRGKGVP
jgi:MFS family permease